MRLLSYITNFGDPYLMSLLAAVVTLWLAATRAWQPFAAWTICFSAGVSLVAASRIAHAVWGIEISALNFAVVSGHSMLSGAVYPTTFGLCAAQERPRTTHVAYLFGLACAAVIGVSRVLMGLHSPVEVLAGWVVGTLIAGVTLILMNPSRARAVSIGRLPKCDTTLFAATALALIVVCHGKVVPVSAWIDNTASGVAQSSRGDVAGNR
ncbi:phosphatase PAP2 family protein [Paraburkholderia aromaticivorans]|jgi:membrane-associated phospholipid phosphatase|uniref:phosphatase PAP2 family protein n=1 Tax=Paraburkholderia aromaticivorans TaxID=2026199 RepID=UPI0038BC55D0